MIAIGCSVTFIISIFKGDWFSVGACVTFYGLSAILASKFNKPYFDLRAVKDNAYDSFLTDYDLSCYTDFFKDTWTTMIRDEIEKRKMDNAA